MSDIVLCCRDNTIDDIALISRGLEMMRGLFSDTRQFGPYADKADRYLWHPTEVAKRGIDIQDWTERGDAAVYKRPTVYVNADAVDCSEQPFIRDVERHTQDGSTEGLIYLETTRLTIRVMSEHGHEARLLGRIVLNHLQGMKDLLPYATEWQVKSCRPSGKTAPFKLRHEHNTDNRWAVDVTVDVKYEILYTTALVAPVLSEIRMTPSV